MNLTFKNKKKVLREIKTCEKLLRLLRLQINKSEQSQKEVSEQYINKKAV